MDAPSGPGAAGSRDWGRSKDDELAARGLARQSRKVYHGGEIVLRALAAAGREQPDASVDLLMEAVWQRLAMDGWPDSVSSPGDPSIRVNIFHSVAGREVAPLIGSTSLKSPQATAREVLLAVMQELDISASPVLDSEPGPVAGPVAVSDWPESVSRGVEVEIVPVPMEPPGLSRGPDGGPEIWPDTVVPPPPEYPPSSAAVSGAAVALSPVAQSLARIYAPPADHDDRADPPPLVAAHDDGVQRGPGPDAPLPGPADPSDQAQGWRARFAALLSKMGSGQPASSRLSLPVAAAIGAAVLTLACALLWMIVSGPGDAASTRPATGQTLPADELTISASSKVEPAVSATPAPWDRPQPQAFQTEPAAAATEVAAESAAGGLGPTVPPPASERADGTGEAVAAAPPSSPSPALSDRLSGQQPEVEGAGKTIPVTDELPPAASPQVLPGLGGGGEEASLLRAELAAARAEAEKLARDQAEIRALLQKQTEMIARLQSKQPRQSATPPVSAHSASAAAEPIAPPDGLPKAITFGPGGTSDLGRIATVADGRRWASVIPGERLTDLARRAERSAEDLRAWNAELGHVTPEMRLESGSVWIDPPRLSR